MAKIAFRTLSLVLSVLVVSAPAYAKLSQKDWDRINRANPHDRDEVQHCLESRNKGKKTGTIAGAAVGGTASLLGGGNLGVTALAAGGGAVAGNLLGKGAGTDKECDAVLKRNP
jgi:outer membrane lipoprotein SlyB